MDIDLLDIIILVLNLNVTQLHQHRLAAVPDHPAAHSERPQEPGDKHIGLGDKQLELSAEESLTMCECG